MALNNDMRRVRLAWPFVSTAVTAVLVLWFLKGWAGAPYAASFAVAILLVTIIQVFRRTQAEARDTAADAFTRAAAGLRQRIEGLETHIASLRTDWEKRFKLLESLSSDVTRLETSFNEALAAEREARGAAIEDALKGETDGRMETIENALGEVQASIKEVRTDTVQSALEDTKKRIAELFAATNELSETLRAEKREREDAIEEALQTEGDMRTKAIQTVTSELLEALEAEREERMAAFERAVRSFSAAAAHVTGETDVSTEVSVPAEEEFEPISVAAADAHDEAASGEDMPEAVEQHVPARDSEEPVPVGGPEEAVAGEAPAAPKPKGKKGRHRGKG